MSIKMKNILKISACILAASVLLTGCIEETFPTDSATESQVTASPFGLSGSVSAIAASMSTPYSYAGSGNNYGFDLGYSGILCVKDAMIYDVICTIPDNTGYDWFSIWTQPSGLGPTNARNTPYTWVCLYNFIKSCNGAIGMLQTAIDESENEASIAEYGTLLGATKAMRAQLYFDLACFYDPLENKYTDVSAVRGLTVPIIDENTTEEEARNTPRATRDELFDFIFSDLDEAETLIAAGGDPAERNLPGLDVVYGIKARAYLWLGGFDATNYAKAAEFAQKAIDTSDCSMLAESEWLNATTGFNTHNHAWMWYLPQAETNISNLVNFIAWRTSEATWGYASMTLPGASTRFYARISDSDWRKKAFIGDDIEAWYAKNSSLTNLPHTSNPNTDWFGAYVGPYSVLKFHPAGGEIYSWNIGNVTDVPLMRIEEMYLIAAEANAQAGDLAAAQKWFKAFIDTRDPGTAVPASARALIDEVIWQKRLEFWGEGVVFNDFKRLNLSLKTGYSKSNIAEGMGFASDGRAPWWNLCIPISEVQRNTALVNNPDPSQTSLKPFVEDM